MNKPEPKNRKNVGTARRERQEQVWYPRGSMSGPSQLLGGGGGGGAGASYLGSRGLAAAVYVGESEWQEGLGFGGPKRRDTLVKALRNYVPEALYRALCFHGACHALGLDLADLAPEVLAHAESLEEWVDESIHQDVIFLHGVRNAAVARQPPYLPVTCQP